LDAQIIVRILRLHKNSYKQKLVTNYGFINA